MNRAYRTGKGAAAAAFAGLADHQPAIDQAKRVCVAHLKADAAACALLPGFDAQTGETQDGITELARTAAQILAHGATAIAAETDGQHPAKVNAQQFGVIS